jgi:hypothetical protein
MLVLTSGRGSAWLERLVRDQEVGGSNPLAPTKHLKHLQALNPLKGLFAINGGSQPWPTARTRTCRALPPRQDEHYRAVLALENGNQSLTIRETRSEYSSKSVGF